MPRPNKIRAIKARAEWMGHLALANGKATNRGSQSIYNASRYEENINV